MVDKKNTQEEYISPIQIRRVILEQAYRARVGHIGSALSVADIITALYTNILHIPSVDDCGRDRFILSKGHSALALYAVLFLKGWLTEEQINSYCSNDTLLGVHPEHALRGVDFSTGSLGHGLSMGAGAALAARLQRSKRRIFVLISDAECNEGSLWEAVMFAAQHHLSNLVAIIDLNGQQAFGYTKDVIDLSPMADRWRAFKWDTHKVDGHNIAEITRSIDSLNTVSGSPHVVIAHTVFGKGVSFMEGQIKWHYLPMSHQEYCQAMNEISDS